MSRRMMSGFVTGSIIGTVIGLYMVSNMSYWERKKMMRKGRKIVSSASNMMRGMNMFM